MGAFGARVEIIPSVDRKITPELVRAMIERARVLSKELGTYWTDQLNNPDNRAGYHPMGEEILEALGGELDAFVAAAGTGGVFSGNAEVLKANDASIRCIAVEPTASRHLSEGSVGGHRIEGIGPGFVPKGMRMDLVDEIIAVSDKDAYDTARRLASVEGLFAGISSGANVLAALKVAHGLGPGRRAVTVAVDSGLKYLAGDLFTEVRADRNDGVRVDALELE